MIRLLPWSNENNVAFEVSGTVSHEEEKNLLKNLDEILAKHAKFIDIHEKYFDAKDADEAWEWVQASE